MREQPNLELEKAEISLSDKKIIYTVNLGGRISSSNLARLLASRSALAGKKVVICDNSEKSFLKNGVRTYKKGNLQ